jgi:hypothetical protein
LPHHDEFQYFDDAVCVAETAKAILCRYENEEFWIPKSVLGADSQVTEKDDEGVLVVKTWFADKEGMI